MAKFLEAIPFPTHSTTTEDQARANVAAYELREIEMLNRFRFVVDCLNGMGSHHEAKKMALETVLELTRGRCRT